MQQIVGPSLSADEGVGVSSYLLDVLHHDLVHGALISHENLHVNTHRYCGTGLEHLRHSGKCIFVFCVCLANLGVYLKQVVLFVSAYELWGEVDFESLQFWIFIAHSSDLALA